LGRRFFVVVELLEMFPKVSLGTLAQPLEAGRDRRKVPLS